MTDYADWGALAALQTFITNLNLASQTLQATATEIADEIEATGVPLLGAPAELYDTTSYILNAAGTNVVIDNASSAALTDMSGYLSYDISIGQQCNTSSTVPFITYRLDWFADSAGSYLMWQEYWTVPSASNESLFSWGTGPVRGHYLQVAVTNEDATYSQTISQLILLGNSRPAPEPTSDWRSTVITSRTVPGYTVPTAGLSADGMVGWWTGTLAASASRALVSSMYFGTVLLGWTVTGTSPDVNIQPQVFLTTHGVADIGELIPATGSTTSGTTELSISRSPVILALTNESATNSADYVLSAVAVPR